MDLDLVLQPAWRRQRRLFLQLAAIAQTAWLAPMRAGARALSRTQATPTMQTPTGHDGRHDFDFLHGQWSIRNERLKQRLAGSNDWEIFHATQRCLPLLGGLGNVDDFISDWTRPGTDERFVGMTLRLFGVESKQWSIYWAGNHDGVLDSPMTGAFADEAQGQRVGTFLGVDEHEGQPVRVRFRWSQASANTAHWQQAFSVDDGATWETNWHMWFRRIDDAGRALHDDHVIELRQYAMQPARRDELIALFEREFIESQEAVGMHVIGQFRDLDAPDRFVWLRGFADMPVRAEALDGFYGGPTWKRHREAANATIADSDDVLLLRPARAGSGLPTPATPRPSSQDAPASGGLIEAGLCALDAPADAGFLERFERDLAPRLKAAGAEVIGLYVTESSANTYPRLSVREGEQVLVWFARFDDVDAHHRYETALLADAAWRDAVAQSLLHGLRQPPQRLRLSPTARSELRA
ncbi:NIPSNAP family protein [Lysobacter auxotrophicus]|uniref:NIPSNAP family protein n=1 Tax=Lysobacter auxotrophicus TaxID=2992573 RepID=A0ABN6UEW0_9GAMM|nr:NIPSNAP family protein [Lysobacter auxotrophicus]BDU14826.1 NIPSNAP family protein [Lysobacter auxotrophicus]